MNNIVMAVVFSVFLKWGTGLFKYSGQGKPPMYGDYEAQRHWMEITYNLPIDEWYFHTKDNDLQYWGLDYPPLTAYHSYVMGYIANSINPKYIALNESRGYESPDHKLFMRYTVLFSDFFTFIPAVILYSVSNQVSSSVSILSFGVETFVMLIYPGLILIDYGHFQYNCVSLGFALMAFATVISENDILSCVLFCLSLSYKQMLLYLSLPFFFYHLGRCRQAGKAYGLIRLIAVSFTVILTFLLTWVPVARNSKQLFQVIHRVFPIARGVFEDKVSNVWCLVNVFLKFRSYLSNENIAIICAVLTLIASLPSCIHLFLRPSKRTFNLCLIISSLSFFLFSYQVHEKSILIVALPVMLYFKTDGFHCLWFLIVSSCSMFPLLVKDGLVIPFIGLHLIFILTLDLFYNVTRYEKITRDDPQMHYTYYIFYISLLIWTILLVLSLIFEPPGRFPDLYPLLISSYSAVHFIYFYIYFSYTQLFKENIKSS